MHGYGKIKGMLEKKSKEDGTLETKIPKEVPQNNSFSYITYKRPTFEMDMGLIWSNKVAYTEIFNSESVYPTVCVKKNPYPSEQTGLMSNWQTATQSNKYVHTSRKR